MVNALIDEAVLDRALDLVMAEPERVRAVAIDALQAKPAVLRHSRQAVCAQLDGHGDALNAADVLAGLCSTHVQAGQMRHPLVGVLERHAIRMLQAGQFADVLAQAQQEVEEDAVLLAAEEAMPPVVPAVERRLVSVPVALERRAA